MKGRRARFVGAGKRREAAGSAALEVLMLIPFIVLIWMLIVNMGYNGFRHRMAQAALRMAAFDFVANISLKNREEAARDTESRVNQLMFPGETGAAKFTFASSHGISGDESNKAAQGLQDSQGMLAKASSRESVAITVTRNPPYADLFPRTGIGRTYIVASNTWTYCELKDKDGSYSSTGIDVFNAMDQIGKYGLWLFGGCGGAAFDLSCDDRCP